MVVIEVVGGTICLVLAVVTTVMALLGGLGLLGVVAFDRCPRCQHLSIRSATVPVRPCVRCSRAALHVQRHHGLHLWHRGNAA
jgi:hypothetical protein